MRYRRVALGLGDRAGLDHGMQHDAGPRARAVEVLHRRKLRGRAHKAGDHRGLGQGQRARACAEVPLRRRIRAIGAGAEVRGVEVAGEDLLLGEMMLEPDGDERLLHFAPRRALVRQQHEAGELLGDRRGALRVAAAQVVDERAQHAVQVDGAVREEAAILHRDDRLAQVRRDVVVGELLALCRAAHGQRRAVRRRDGQRARCVARRAAVDGDLEGEVHDAAEGKNEQRGERVGRAAQKRVPVRGLLQALRQERAREPFGRGGPSAHRAALGKGGIGCKLAAHVRPREARATPVAQPRVEPSQIR